MRGRSNIRQASPQAQPCLWGMLALWEEAPGGGGGGATVPRIQKALKEHWR